MRKNQVVILTILLSVLMGSVYAAQTSDPHNMQNMSMSGNKALVQKLASSSKLSAI